MSETKVRYEDLHDTLQAILDNLSVHTHDGVQEGGVRVSFNDLVDVPDNIVNLASTQIVGEIPTPTGSPLVFTLTNDVVNNDKIGLYVHGTRQTLGVDYTVVNNTITFVVAPPNNSNLLADYQPVI